MRILVTLALLGGFLCSQESTKTETGTKTNSSVTFSGPPRLSQITIPAGTKIPVTLKNTISTKSNHEGDPIYAQSTFPIVIDDKIVVPAGTYLQGRIGAIKPAGRIKNRAEVLIHFTTLIYPSGYTVLLPGALENAPGVNQASVKDKEGAIRADSNAGHKVGTVAPRSAEAGAVVGGLATRAAGGVVGGGVVGAAAGTAIALLTRGNEVKIGPGATLEVVLQRDVAIDASRIRASAAERE